MRPGDVAPDFELPDQDGRRIRLAGVLGAGPVVVYFYPRAGTPGCTREACGFRDAQDAFAASGARVVGVSGDSVDALARFARDRKLGFTLLSDADGAVRARWGVPRDFGVLPGRVTYVLDAVGVVRRVRRRGHRRGGAAMPDRPAPHR